MLDNNDLICLNCVYCVGNFCKLKQKQIFSHHASCLDFKEKEDE